MEVWQARVAEVCAWGWRTREVPWTKQTALFWLAVAPKSLLACFDPLGRSPCLEKQARGGEGTTCREDQVVGTFLRSRIVMLPGAAPPGLVWWESRASQYHLPGACIGGRGLTDVALYSGGEWGTTGQDGSVFSDPTPCLCPNLSEPQKDPEPEAWGLGSASVNRAE